MSPDRTKCAKSDFRRPGRKTLMWFLLYQNPTADKPLRHKAPEKSWGFPSSSQNSGYWNKYRYVIKQREYWINTPFSFKMRVFLKLVLDINYHNVVALGQYEEGSLSSEEKAFSTAEFKHVIACHTISISRLMKGRLWVQTREEMGWTGSRGKTRSQTNVSTSYQMIRK